MDSDALAADRALPFSAVRLVPRELANNHYAVALASDPAACTAYPHWSTAGENAGSAEVAAHGWATISTTIAAYSTRPSTVIP